MYGVLWESRIGNRCKTDGGIPDVKGIGRQGLQAIAGTGIPIDEQNIDKRLMQSFLYDRVASLTSGE